MLFLRQLPYLALVCASCEGASPNGKLLRLRRRMSYPFTNSSTSDIQSSSVLSSYESTDASGYDPPSTFSISDSTFPSSSYDSTEVSGYNPPSTSSISDSSFLQSSYEPTDASGYDLPRTSSISSSSLPPRTSSFSDSGFLTSGSNISTSPFPTPIPSSSSIFKACSQTCDKLGCHRACDDGEEITAAGGFTEFPWPNATELPVPSGLSNSSSLLGNSSITSIGNEFPLCTSTVTYNTTEVFFNTEERCAGATTIYENDYVVTVTETEIIETITVAASNATWTPPTPPPTITLPPCTESDVYEATTYYPDGCVDETETLAAPLDTTTESPTPKFARPETDRPRIMSDAGLSEPDSPASSDSGGQGAGELMSPLGFRQGRTTTVTTQKTAVVISPTESPMSPFGVLPGGVNPEMHPQVSPDTPPGSESSTDDGNRADGRAGSGNPYHEPSSTGSGSGESQRGSSGSAPKDGDAPPGDSSPAPNIEDSKPEISSPDSSPGGSGDGDVNSASVPGESSRGDSNPGGSGSGNANLGNSNPSGNSGPADSGSGYASPGNSNPSVNSGPADSGSVNTSPGNSNPGPADSNPGNSSPGQYGSSGNSNPDQSGTSGGSGVSGNSNPGQSGPSGNSSPANSNSGSLSAGNSGTGNANPGNSVPGASNSGGSNPGVFSSDSANSGASVPERPSDQGSGIGESTDSTTIMANNVPIVLSPNAVVVGSQTIAPGSAPTNVDVNGETYNVGPSQITGPGITLALAPPPDVAGSSGNPAPTAVTAEGVAFSLGPSQAVIEGTTYDVGSGAAPTAAVVNGQTIEIGPQGIGIGSTTVAIPSAAAPPILSSVTAAGLTFAVNPTEAVIDGSTYHIGGRATPTTAVINGQTVRLGPGGVGLESTTVAVPPGGGAGAGPALSSVTAAGLTFGVNPTEAVIEGTTYRIGGGAQPTIAVINGQTVSLGPGGVGLESTTVAVPSGGGAGAGPSLTAVTADGLTFSLNPTEAVISGTTYSIGAGATTPTTAIINGQTVSLGPGGIGFGSTTIAVPRPTFSAVTAGGLTFSINPTQAVISGTTYSIGIGAAPTTTVINGQTISLGPGGVGLATTTVPVPRATRGAQQPSSVITVGDLTITVELTEAVISGTTYAIGDGATPTTTVINGQTVSLGPEGVGLPSTTIPPLPTATGTGPLTGGAGRASARKESMLGLLLAAGVGGLILL